MLLTTINDNKVKKKKTFDFRRVEHFCGDSSRIIVKKVNLEPCLPTDESKRIIQTQHSVDNLIIKQQLISYYYRLLRLF